MRDRKMERAQGGMELKYLPNTQIIGNKNIATFPFSLQGVQRHQEGIDTRWIQLD